MSCKLHFLNTCSLLLLLITSCGIREDKKTLKNLLDGKWKLNKFECYQDNELIESFSLVSINETLELLFSGREIVYEISGTCNELSTAKYAFAFSTIKTGLVSFYEENLGSNCTIEIFEDATNEDVLVPIQISASKITDLIWNREVENELALTHFNEFKGTSLSTGCNDSCNCLGVWFKN